MKKLLRLSSLLVALFLLLNFAQPINASSSKCNNWENIPDALGAGILRSVSAISDNDVWAGGEYVDWDLYAYVPVVEHWNGSQWTVIPAPEGTFGHLFSVVALASNDVWAVGNIKSSNRYVVLHWNGSSLMTVPVSNEITSTSPLIYFNSVAASASNDVWAIGTQVNGAGGTGPYSQPIIDHWNGTGWTRYFTLKPKPVSALTGITVISGRNIWMVGNSSKDNGLLSAHLHNSVWDFISMRLPKNSGGLSAVDAISPKDIWAVGSQNQDDLTEHWNGNNWSMVKAAGGSTAQLASVSTVSSENVWAVGTYRPHGHLESLIEHWNGSSWKMISLPSYSDFNGLNGVSATSDGVWAVGNIGGIQDGAPLIWHSKCS